MFHWEWLESLYKDSGVKCSQHGRDVAQILGIVYGGLYHISAKLEKVKWDHERAIEIKISYPNLATFDFNNLTKLVILCHDACIRLEIEPNTFNSIRFWFHRREGREGSMSRRHPTIEQAIENTRKSEGPKLEERTSCAENAVKNDTKEKQ
jgi:hypothetical protein